MIKHPYKAVEFFSMLALQSNLKYWTSGLVPNWAQPYKERRLKELKDELLRRAVLGKDR